MNQFELLHKINSILPDIKEWIRSTLEEHKDQAVPVINLDFLRIKEIFPLEILKRAKAVIVSGDIPFPPIGRMGMEEFAQMENMLIAGITYPDTFFVNPLHKTDESLFFHEMVHVIQWDRLGVDNFILAYAMGLMQAGYEGSPLEKMAYELQSCFEKDRLPENIVEVIQKKTDSIWSGVIAEVKRLSE